MKKKVRCRPRLTTGKQGTVFAKCDARLIEALDREVEHLRSELRIPALSRAVVIRRLLEDGLRASGSWKDGAA
jgi:hypothetical protein